MMNLVSEDVKVHAPKQPRTAQVMSVNLESGSSKFVVPTLE